MPPKPEKRQNEGVEGGASPKRKRLNALSKTPQGFMSFKTEPAPTFASLANIKKEPEDNKQLVTNHVAVLSDNDIRKKLLAMLHEHKNGFGNPLLVSSLPNVERQRILTILNEFLKNDKIQLLQTRDKKPIYKLKTMSNAISEATSLEERLIIEHITNAGNKGLSSYELKRRINISVMILNKMLKDLEKRKVIKSVTIGSSKRKVFMLATVTPDATLTGDALFGDKDLESGIVEEMCQTCLRYLQSKYEDSTQLHLVACRNSALASSKEIFDELSKRNITSKELEVSHVERLLFKLELSGEVEKVVRPGSLHNSYRYLPQSRQIAPSLGVLPCATCKHIEICSKPHSLVHPSTCAYMQEWLDF